jgi:ribosomal protein L40E
MGLELLAAGLVGLAVLWVVLQPLVAPAPPRPRAMEPPDPEETPKGIALTALKEIEFDRETGKLSTEDYELLKAKYTAAALEALRAESAARPPDDIEAMIAARVRTLRSAETTTSPGACPSCGPRLEPDAIFCSSCGTQLLHPSTCGRCGAELAPESRFCQGCGSQVAA